MELARSERHSMPTTSLAGLQQEFLRIPQRLFGTRPTPSTRGETAEKAKEVVEEEVILMVEVDHRHNIPSMPR